MQESEIREEMKKIVKNGGKCNSALLHCESCPIAEKCGPKMLESTQKAAEKWIAEHPEKTESHKTCKQTTPPHTGNTRVLDSVLSDLKTRAEMGKQKYGHYLETQNGRNSLQDAYEECLDLCMYLKQRILEEEGK